MNCMKGCLWVQNFFVAKMAKGKSNDVEWKDEWRKWKDPIELKGFFDLCSAQVLAGNRSKESLKNEGCDEMIK